MSEESQDEHQTEYRKILCEAFFDMADGLKSYIEKILRDKYQETWQNNLASINGHPPSLEDPYILLATIKDHWHKDTFKGKLNVILEDIKDLFDARNATFHSDRKFQFTAESVNGYINKMLHLMTKVPTSSRSIKTVDNLKKLKYRVSHLATEAPYLKIQEITHNSDQADSLKEAEPVEIPAGQLSVSSGTSKLVEISTVQLPVSSGDLRVEIVDDPKSKWVLLHIFDGERLIGIYEKSGTKEQAEKKRVEIPCAVAELREAFKKNNEKPFIVEWNGKLREKQIKSDGSKSAAILKIIPKPYWWTNSKRCEKCEIPGPYCR